MSVSSFINSTWFPLLLLILTPVTGAITWWIRGYIEKNNSEKEKHKEEVRQHTIKTIEIQISDFYWPMYLNLARYKKYSNKYNDFKEGHFTLSSGESSLDHFEKDSQLDYKIDMIDFLESRDSRSSQDSNNIDDNISSKSVKPKKFIFNLSESLNSNTNKLELLDKFNLMIEFYKKRMIDILYDIQKIYTLSAPKAEPDRDLIIRLIELDEYITYYTSFYENNYEKIHNVNLENKFPSVIYTLVSTRLHFLQDKYNNLIYERHPDMRTREKINFDLNNVVVDKGLKDSIFKTIKRRGRGKTL